MLKKVLQLILGLSIFILIISFTDYSALKDISFRPIFFILIFISTLSMCAISALKWSIIANYFAKQKILSFYKYFFYLLLGRIGAFFGPKDIADFGIRTGSLKFTKKISLYKSFHSVFFDRLIELIIAILLAIPCFLFFINIINIWITISTMCFVFLIIFGFLILSKYKFSIIISKFFYLVLKIFGFVPYFKKKIIKYGIIEQNREIELPNFLFLKLSLLSFLKFVFTIFQIYFVSLALSIEIPLLFIIIALPLIQLSFVFAFTPGGLGISEASWFVLLNLFGISSASIPIFLVGQRILVLVSVLIITLFAFVFYSIKNKKLT